MAVGVLQASAGEKCCAGKAAEAGTKVKPAKMAMCEKACAAVAAELTPEQRAVVDAARAECMKAGCTPESCAACMKKCAEALTPEQQAKMQAACQKAGKGKEKAGCPMTKSAE